MTLTEMNKKKLQEIKALFENQLKENRLKKKKKKCHR